MSSGQKQVKHDFGWGDTTGIRRIMVAHAMYVFDKPRNYNDFGYPPHEGDPGLIKELHKLIFNLTGRNYRYVLITNGATNGLNAYLYAKRSEYKPYLFTSELYFGFYPSIAKLHNMIHKPGKFVSKSEPGITIVDSPSNPMGKLSGLNINDDGENVVWDAAYYSPTYCGVLESGKLRNHRLQPVHDAMVGSLNKLTGINGLRVGWLATDRKQIYDKALEYVTNDLCGVSYISQVIARDILAEVDLDQFYKESKALLDSNRTELQRLSHIFGNQEIPVNGMFALFEVDEGIKKLLEKAGVRTMPGEFIGDSRDTVRINLAKSNEDTKLMVDDILKADSR